VAPVLSRWSSDDDLEEEKLIEAVKLGNATDINQMMTDIK
jgi:hypothetical protein